MNILNLKKMGCDFWKDEPLKATSDLENYRLRFEYVNKNGQLVAGDVSRSYSFKNGKKDKDNIIGFDLEFEQNGVTLHYKIADVLNINLNDFLFNSESLLKIVNMDSNVRFDKIKIN